MQPLVEERGLPKEIENVRKCGVCHLFYAVVRCIAHTDAQLSSVVAVDVVHSDADRSDHSQLLAAIQQSRVQSVEVDYDCYGLRAVFIAYLPMVT